MAFLQLSVIRASSIQYDDSVPEPRKQRTRPAIRKEDISVIRPAWRGCGAVYTFRRSDALAICGTIWHPVAVLLDEG